MAVIATENRYVRCWETGSERRAVKVTRLDPDRTFCRPIGAELTTQIGSASPRGRRTFEMRSDGGTQSPPITLKWKTAARPLYGHTVWVA